MTGKRFHIKAALGVISLLSLFFIKPVSAATVEVLVSDGTNLISGATVYAINFSNDGPNPTTSVVGVTNSTGAVTLTLTDNTEYDFLASNHGNGPTLRSQMFNPLKPHINSGTGHQGQITVTLDGTFAAGDTRGIIRADVTNSGTALPAGRMLFGNVRKNSSGSDVAFGVCVTDGGGICAMQFHNVKTAAANTYDVGVFDPQGNGGVGQGDGTQLASAVTTNATVVVALDLNGGFPPDFSASQGDQGFNDGHGGEADIEGIVHHVGNSSTTVPFGYVALLVNNNGQTYERFWSHVDHNGRFRFSGVRDEFLNNGTSYYYVRASGGCRNDGRCFEGWESTAATTGAVPVFSNNPNTQENDIIYVDTTTTLNHAVRLATAAAGAGQLGINVVDQSGNPIPGAWVNLWPDGQQWHVDVTTPLCNNHPPFDGATMNQVDVSSPGFTNRNVQATTGYALLSELRPGNYELSVWTPFSQQGTIFNAGPDGQWSFNNQGGNNHRGCYSGSHDDLRLTVEADNSITIYTTSGTVVPGNANIISTNVVVNVSSGIGRIYGTATFTEVADLRNQPINIILRGACGENGCEGGGFDVLNGSGSATYGYEIFVPTVTSQGQPANYFPEIVSSYWGAVFTGGEQFQIIFNGTQTIRRDFNFAPAGQVAGLLFKPDGSIFLPGDNGTGQHVGAGIEARGIDVESWGYAEVKQDGSFLIGGLLPGEYELFPRLHGSGSSFAPPEPRPRVRVFANADAYLDVQFVEGEVLLVEIDNTNLPSLTRQIESDFAFYKGETYSGVRFQAGTPFTADNLPTILDGHIGESQIFSDVPPGNGPCGPSWPGGYCPQRVPTNSLYDIYAMRRGDFGEDGLTNKPYFVILDSTKNVVVNRDTRSGVVISTISNSQWFNADPVRVNFPFSPGEIGEGVTVTGVVGATHMLREPDFNSLGGSFENFIRFIPVIALYNSSGSITAAGLVVPPADVIDGAVGDQIEASVVNGDWAAFQQATQGLTWSFEIRGVPANQTFTLIGTTPNYPTYSTSTTTGADGSTTTVNFNWDTAVGQGNTITGVVQTTNSVVLANASVKVQARGYREKVLTTDTNGVYRVEGLPQGLFELTAQADGYAPLKKEVYVQGNSTFTVHFDLQFAPGIIEGTVRELVLTAAGPVRKPVQDALVLAFDDTFNVNNTTSPLALYKVVTSSTGFYQLRGMVPGNVYSMAVMAPGRYVNTATVTATAGTVTQNFDLDKKPLEIDVQACRSPDRQSIIMKILNPHNFESGQVWYSTAPIGQFEVSVATDISNQFSELPDGTLLASIPVSDLVAGTQYTLHIEAVPATDDPTVTKEIVFGTNIECVINDNIDDRICGNPTADAEGIPSNEVRLDRGGNDNSAIVFPPGAATVANANDLPDMNVSAQDPDVAGIAAADITFTGNVTALTLNTLQLTGRPLKLILSYDPTLAAGRLSDLVIYLDNGNGDYTELTGAQYTVDPVQKTIEVQYDISSLPGFQISHAGHSGTMRMLRGDKQFLPNPRALMSGSGSFVSGLAVSTGTTAPSNTYIQYNFPNPFNLKPKTVTLRSGTSGVASNITGTYIVIAPTGTLDTTAAGTIRIYSVAGDLVREFNETLTAGRYNYIHWDGKNTAGSNVASGVYFAVVDAPGSDKSNHIKMVVVK